MPVEETTKLKIKCDNPDCKGNDLDPGDRAGWIFITHEVYGEASKQNVFCSYDCVSQASATPSFRGEDETSE